MRNSFITIFIVALCLQFPLNAVAFFGSADTEKSLSELYEAFAIFDPKTQVSKSEIGITFNIGTDSTEIQRDAFEKQIRGKYIYWNTVVYEISKSSDKVYRISVVQDDNQPGIFIYINVINKEHDEKILYNLQTGSTLSFFGKIVGVSLRHLKVDPAIIMDSENIDFMKKHIQKKQQPATNATQTTSKEVKISKVKFTCMSYSNKREEYFIKDKKGRLFSVPGPTFFSGNVNFNADDFYKALVDACSQNRDMSLMILEGTNGGYGPYFYKFESDGRVYGSEALKTRLINSSSSGK